MRYLGFTRHFQLLQNKANHFKTERDVLKKQHNK